MSPSCHPEVPVQGHEMTTPWQVIFVVTNYIFLVRLLGLWRTLQLFAARNWRG